MKGLTRKEPVSALSSNRIALTSSRIEHTSSRTEHTSNRIARNGSHPRWLPFRVVDIFVDNCSKLSRKHLFFALEGVYKSLIMLFCVTYQPFLLKKDQFCAQDYAVQDWDVLLY